MKQIQQWKTALLILWAVCPSSSLVSAALSQITTIAGTGIATPATPNGNPALSTNINLPFAIWGDSLGNIYYGERNGYKVRKIDAVTTIVTTVAGTGVTGYGNTVSSNTVGKATSATFVIVYGLCVDSSGNNMYIADGGSKRVLQVDLTTGMLTRLVNAAGTSGSSAGDGGAASAAALNTPYDVWGDSNNNIYITDSNGHKIRKVTSAGIISTLAGTGSRGSTGDGGAATAATLNQPYFLFGDSMGSMLYVTTLGDNKVRAITLTGGVNIINTFAGTGTASSTNIAGAATATGMMGPQGIVGDLSGNVFVADSGGNRIKKVAVGTNIMSTIAGTGTASSSPTAANGDGGDPTAATLRGLIMLFYNPMGSLYIADYNNNKIRKLFDSIPTSLPSSQPISDPSSQPSSQPNIRPTMQPSSDPTLQPSLRPLSQPTMQPLLRPSSQPSSQPYVRPSVQPSSQPSMQPVLRPSTQPSGAPSRQPIMQPSSQPSLQPNSRPSSKPSSQPSMQPISRPTTQPSAAPSRQPTVQPSSQPSLQPSNRPSDHSINHPSSHPVSRPSTQPSTAPSRQPTVQPSTQPSVQPSISPSGQRNKFPSTQPSNTPTMQPTVRPSQQPSSQPSIYPSEWPSNRSHFPLSVLPTSERPSSSVVESISSVPTVRATKFNEGRLPNYRTITVLDGAMDKNYNTSYTVAIIKITLPYLRSSVTVNDGFYDINVGSNLDVLSTSYVLLGNNRTVLDNKIYLAYMKPTTGFLASPVLSYDYSGRSVSNAGDINGDGFDDLIIGVPYAARCYVMFGTNQGFVDMTEGFTIFGEQVSDLTGWSVSGAGDVNNDTYADIILGAPRAVGSAGVSYVLFGKHFGFTDIYLEFLQETQGFSIEGVAGGDCSGLSVSGAGMLLNLIR